VVLELNISFIRLRGTFIQMLFVDNKNLDKDKETWTWGSIKVKGSTPEKIQENGDAKFM